MWRKSNTSKIIQEQSKHLIGLWQTPVVPRTQTESHCSKWNRTFSLVRALQGSVFSEPMEGGIRFI